MIELKKILLATDFSDHATKAKQMALDLCGQFNAELHVLHVVHDVAVEVPEFGMGLAFPSFVDDVGSRRKEMKDKARLALESEISESWRTQHCVVFETRFGKPFVEIVGYAGEYDIDLIVVGSHGRSGISHVLLGSVAEKVVQKAPCPVLTIRQPTVPPPDEEMTDFRVGIHPLPVG